MSDVTQALASETQFLWVLFLTLFMILCFITVFAVCHCCFCQRYLVCEWKLCGCCCHLDVQEYRRERRDLRQLRELRQRRAELEVEHLATFTQIPGPIPDSYGFRELRRQSAIRDLTSLGFIVVTPPPHEVNNSLETRNQLTAQQRRDILKRLLACRVCLLCMCIYDVFGINRWTKYLLFDLGLTLLLLACCSPYRFISI